MNQRREFQQKRPWNMRTSEVLEQEYTLCLKVFQYSVWKRFNCKKTLAFEIPLIQRPDMGRTEGRACFSKGGSAESSPSLSCRSRTRIQRQCFLLVDLESQFVYTVLLTVESFYFQPANYVFIFVVTVWQFFVQLVLRSPLPLEPVGYSCWCNCSCNFCAGLRNTVHYLLRNHCC